MAVGFESDPIELSRVFTGQGVFIRVPVRHVFDVAELDQRDPVDHYLLVGSRFLVALNTSYDLFQCCLVLQHLF